MTIYKRSRILLLMLILLGFLGVGIQRTVAQEATETYTTQSNTIIEMKTSTDTTKWYTENTYTVDITVQVREFGGKVDRVYEIYLWARIGIEPSVYIDQQGPKGPYALLAKGTSKTVSFNFFIQPKKYNLEEGHYYPIAKLEYYMEFCEGVVVGFDNKINIGWDSSLTVEIHNPRRETPIPGFTALPVILSLGGIGTIAIIRKCKNWGRKSN